MNLTPLTIAFLIAAAVLYIVSEFAPTPSPTWISKTVKILSGVATLVLTFTGVTAYPAALPAPTWVLGLALVGLAALSPLLGLLENMLLSPRIAYAKSRVPGHLATNIVGATLAGASIALARTFATDESAATGFNNDLIFNVFLVISTLVVVYFIYGQQQSPTIQERYENSLARWHQLSNMLYLIAATFVTITSFLYVFAIALVRAKAGSPLEFSWQAGVTLSLAFIFTLACGLPRVRDSHDVFMTFLTGTPAVLCTSILWLSFFRDSPERNIFALVATTLTYSGYVTLVVLERRTAGVKPSMHYYSSLAFGLLLVTLLVGLYLN